MRLSFIVCSNGLGHLKRVLGVADEVLSINKNVRITIFCSEYARSKVNDFHKNHLEKIEFDSSLSINEPLVLSSIDYNISQYNLWEIEIRNNSKLKQSDLIVSDNQILPCKCFEKSILMGSFLWPFTVSPKSNDLHRILLAEVEWLKRNKPTLLGVNDMLQSDLHKYASIVGLPWFEKNCRDSEIVCRERVYFTVGATGIYKQEIKELICELQQINPKLEITLDPLLYNEIGENLGVTMFDFQEKSFLKLKAIVCRPGMGILNDAVKYGIPVFAVHDGANDEIKFNARRVVDLGIGLEVDFNFDGSRKINSHLSRESWITNTRNAFYNLKSNGQRIAAKYLIHKIYESSKM